MEGNKQSLEGCRASSAEVLQTPMATPLKSLFLQDLALLTCDGSDNSDNLQNVFGIIFPLS